MSPKLLYIQSPKYSIISEITCTSKFLKDGKHVLCVCINGLVVSDSLQPYSL